MVESAHRVEESTPQSINERVRHDTERSIAQTVAAGPRAIEARLMELDREWDVERSLEALASSFTIAGIGLAVTVDRKWLIFPSVVAAFLLQHALQGWCPPLPVIRALGFRTVSEIDRERIALKMARGDFRAATELGSASPGLLLAAAER
jgi:hypothetical protein